MRNGPRSPAKGNISLSCPAGKSDFHFYKAREALGNRASSDSVINFKEKSFTFATCKKIKK